MICFLWGEVDTVSPWLREPQGCHRNHIGRKPRKFLQAPVLEGKGVILGLCYYGTPFNVVTQTHGM